MKEDGLAVVIRTDKNEIGGSGCATDIESVTTEPLKKTFSPDG